MPSCNWLAISLVFLAIQVSARDWEIHKTSVRSGVEKVHNIEKEIEELIHEKKSTQDQKMMSEILEKIKHKHHELTELVETLNKERDHMKYEHPEEGDESERQYLPMRIRSIDEFEREGGIDGRLTDLREKVKKKYGMPKSLKAQSKTTPAAYPTAPPHKTQKDLEAEREAKRIKMTK